jgi:hypothetical protein
VALDFTGGTSDAVDNLTFGWAFSLSSAVLLTDLGLWDENSDGLTNSTQVTIWTSAGVQVAQAMVDNSGTFVASSVDGFRYVSVAPTLLAAGNYTIGGYYVDFADALRSSAATITTASGVTYNGSRSIGGNAFPPTDTAGVSNSYFGPNFQFTTDLNGNGVPEGGSTFILMLGSLAALVVTRRLCQAPAKI